MRRFAALTVVALAALAALPAAASAHPLGNFTVNRYSLVEPSRGGVDVTFVLDIAEIPTFQALGERETTARALAWARHEAPGWARRLRLQVGGRLVRLAPRPPVLSASLRPGQGGLAIMRVVLPLHATVAGAGPFHAEYRDESFGGRLGWKEVVMRAGPGVVLERSSASTHDVSHMLTRYPAGLLSTPLDVRGSRFDYRYGSGGSVDVGPASGSGGENVGTWGSRFTDLIARHDGGAGFLAVALALSVLWGALHALTPGHGKSIVAAYLVGARGTARHALFLGATVTATHTAGVFALGLVTLELSGYVVPETLYPWLSLVSGLIVLAMAISIGGARLARLAGPRHAHGHHGPHHHHGPGGRSHLPPGADGAPITMRSLLALGVSGGILPCPSALVVMLGAIALHRVAFGLVLVVAFSLGLAGTLSAVGLLVVYARRLLERAPGSARAAALIPAASAGAIAVLGGVLTVRALETSPGGPSSAALALVAATLAASVGWQVLRLRRDRAHPHEHHHPHEHPHVHGPEGVHAH